MSFQHELKNILQYIPSNCGYIVNNRRYFGKKEPTDDNIVKLISEDTGERYIWTRNVYIVEKAGKCTDHDFFMGNNLSWLSANHIKKQSCPIELLNGGVCQDRNNYLHKKTFYHFAAYDKDGIIEDDGYVKCRYNSSNGLKCWESCNGDHNDVFFH